MSGLYRYCRLTDVQRYYATVEQMLSMDPSAKQIAALIRLRKVWLVIRRITWADGRYREPARGFPLDCPLPPLLGGLHRGGGAPVSTGVARAWPSARFAPPGRPGGGCVYGNPGFPSKARIKRPARFCSPVGGGGGAGLGGMLLPSASWASASA